DHRPAVPVVDEGARRLNPLPTLPRKRGRDRAGVQPAGAGAGAAGVSAPRSDEDPQPSLPRSRERAGWEPILARLLALHPKRIDLSLDRIERVLAALDHPERHLPPLIHVAGTNGKGSTIAFARAILEAAGKRVHVYTSPDLVRLNERFRIGRSGGGKLVDDAELADVLAECEAKNGDAPITVFEIETAAAFLLFARHPADIVVLEVGLGGRLDATN